MKSQSLNAYLSDVLCNKTGGMHKALLLHPQGQGLTSKKHTAQLFEPCTRSLYKEHLFSSKQ